jgi:hypothetical protein
MNNHCEALIAHPCSSSFEDASQFPDAKSRQQCLQAMACDPAPKAKSNHVPSLTHIYPRYPTIIENMWKYLETKFQQ